MKRVRVLYFAAVRDAVGLGEEILQMEASARVSDLRVSLGRLHPALAGSLGQVRVARNEVFATDDEPLEDGDVLALIPPVAGG